MTSHDVASGSSRTSTTRETIAAALADGGVIAVIRMTDGACLARVVDALARGGVRAIEVTMTVPNAIGLIAELAPTLPAGVVIGAGTVLDAHTAEAAIRSGARFVVSPVFRSAVIAAAHHDDCVAMPGCFTPTEIVNAIDAGADMVKLFPAGSLGPGFIRDLLAPLPSLRLVPSGGISIDSAAPWIRAGAAAVGIGSALVDARVIAAGDFDTIARNAERLVASVRAARESR